MITLHLSDHDLLQFQDKLKHGFITTTKTTSIRTTTSTSTKSSTTTKKVLPLTSLTTPSTTATTTKTTVENETKSKLPISTTATIQWMTSKRFHFSPNTTSATTTSTTESTPYPPLTLSLGAWQITEEDLPIYVGSAAGVLLLIIVLLGVTTWRCSIVSTHTTNSPIKSKEESSKLFVISQFQLLYKSPVFVCPGCYFLSPPIILNRFL